MTEKTREFSKATDRKVFWERFTIGNPDCPIMHRLTIVRHPRLGSARLHNFCPNADDRDVHDHPWNFLTFVLRGYYDDFAPCTNCESGLRYETEPPVSVDGIQYGTSRMITVCDACNGRGTVLRERMSRGKIRFRSAKHAHITHVGPEGCLTFVLTGPVIRDWGFIRAGRWIWWKSYGALHGFAMNCENTDAEGIVRREAVGGHFVPPAFEKELGRIYREEPGMLDEEDDDV